MAENRSFTAPAVLRDQLQRFYDKPVTRVSLELFLSLMTVLFFALFALRPTINTMSRLVREIEEKRQISDDLTRKMAALSTAQREYLAQEPRLSLLRTAYHQTVSIDEVLYYLEYITQQANISLLSAQMHEVPVDLPPAAQTSSTQVSAVRQPLQAFEVELSFQGEYREIQEFFRMVESIRPLWVVESFSLRVDQKSEDSRILTGSATLSLFGINTNPIPKTAAEKPAARSAASSGIGEEEE